MKQDTIYDYDELKLKLLPSSKYKIIYEQDNSNIKFIEINKKIEYYKKELNQEKTFITAFIIYKNKVVMQYDKRLDQFNMNIFDNYSNKKDDLKIIIYLFDATVNNNCYLKFLNICENIKFKINLKNYFSIFSKISLPLSGFLSISFTLFTIFALSEYGIPLNKVTDFNTLAILQIFSILFLSIIFSLFGILMYLLLIPLLLYFFVGIKSIFILALIQILIIFILTKYLKKYNPILFSKIFKSILKFSIFIMGSLYLSFSILVFVMMSQSIISSYFPNFKLYDKTGYELAMHEYLTKFSGYPKILIKNQKEYYVPAIDSDYYYVYDLEESEELYLSSLKQENMKPKLESICKDSNTIKEFQKNYIPNNPHIKPQFLNEKIKIEDNDELKSFKYDNVIKLEKINELCNNFKAK